MEPFVAGIGPLGAPEIIILLVFLAAVIVAVVWVIKKQNQNAQIPPPPVPRVPDRDAEDKPAS